MFCSVHNSLFLNERCRSKIQMDIFTIFYREIADVFKHHIHQTIEFIRLIMFHGIFVGIIGIKLFERENKFVFNRGFFFTNDILTRCMDLWRDECMDVRDREKDVLHRDGEVWIGLFPRNVNVEWIDKIKIEGDFSHKIFELEFLCS